MTPMARRPGAFAWGGGMMDPRSLTVGGGGGGGGGGGQVVC